MSENDIPRAITRLAEPLAASIGLEIWGVEAAFGKGGVIRVYVEGDMGVDIDKCAELSRLLGLSLDVEDIIPGAYVLEVSSPGLERTFFTPEQLAAAVDSTVEVTLHAPCDAYPDRKKLLGTLVSAVEETFSLIPRDAVKPSCGAPSPAVFGWADIKKAKLAHFLPELPGTAKGKKPRRTTSAPKPDTARKNDKMA